MRTLLLSFFCVFWTLCLLAPAVVTLVEDDGIVLVLPLHEEEPEEDSENELKVPNWVVPALADDRKGFPSEDRAPAYHGKRLLVPGHQEVVLPPPKAC